MDITWDDVANALFGLKTYIKNAGLWYSIASDVTITDAFIASVRENVEDAYLGFKE